MMVAQATLALWPFFAAEGSGASQIDVQLFLLRLGASIIYVLVGMVFFAVSFWIIRKVTPFSIRKEIEEDQNTSLAIVIASVFIGIAIIIAAAIHG